MSLFSKILLGIVVAIFAYALWPRNGSMVKFDPQTCAQHELAAWQALRKGNTMRAAGSYYLIYDLQFGVSPVTALSIAREKTSSIHSIFRSTDPADQDRMIPQFVEAATRLRRDVAEEFDPAVAGRAEFSVWVAVADKAQVDALEKLVATQLSALYSLPDAGVQKAAALRARALTAAFEPPADGVSWDKVQADLTGSWEALKQALPTPSPNPQ